MGEQVKGHSALREGVVEVIPVKMITSWKIFEVGGVIMGMALL
jgi:hypothetical protein